MAGTVTVTSSDNGKSVDAHVGDAVFVSLAENPTTGYRWELEAPDDALVLEHDTFDMAADPVVGSGGTRRIEFRAKTPRSLKIAFRLVRSWARNEPPMQILSINLRILP